MATIAGPLLCFAAASLLLTLIAQLAAHRVLARVRPRAGLLPPLSILKPLKGVDDALFENLCSFALLDYPCFEVLFGIASESDPACEVARRVQRAFPEVPIRVVICGRALGRNPKVSLLAALERTARYDLVLISDSNVRARPDYLRAVAAEMTDPRVGLVSNVIAGTGERTPGALLENLQLGSFIASSVSAADAIAGHACVIGKSMLLRRSALARLGGFRAVRHVLAEDYVLGRKFQRAGYRVVLSPHVLETVNQDWTVGRFLERHLRWAQMRRRLNLAAYIGEPILNPTPWLLALLCCAAAKRSAWQLGPASLGAMAAAGLLIKAAADLRLLFRLRGHSISLADLPLIYCKDLLVLALWATAFFRTTVCWRGNELRVARGSRLLPARRTPVLVARIAVGAGVPGNQ
jgi:ceramide glucosyltransferase